MRIEPETGSVAIVLLGRFNPAIFSPLWFSRSGITTERETDQAEISIIHPDVSIFRIGTKNLHVDRERFQIETTEAPWVIILDFVLRTFREALPHTPVFQLGINRLVHFSVGSEEIRNRIGGVLAPTAPWGDWGH